MAGELPVIDPAKLARRTMASDTVETEMLALFDAECQRLLSQIRLTGEPKLRSDRLNAVWAAARNVGAARLAALAADLAGRAELGPSDLARLEMAVDEIRAAIRRSP